MGTIEDQHASREGITGNQVMTAREVARLLRLAPSTVYDLARRGELPSTKLGGSVRFLRPQIELHLKGRDGWPV